MNLTTILDEVHALLTDYVAFPSVHGGYAATAWVPHAHAVTAFESTPRLAALSPEPGSGKTRLLEAIEVLVPKPVFAVNITGSALFRMVAQGNATLLLDEADTYLGHDVVKQHEDIRALVNAGHRRSGVAYRTEMNGKKGEVVAFPAFAPCAIAGSGDLPDTILDRSVVIAMKRRAPHEKVTPFREREARNRAEPLRAELVKWAIANHGELAEARPEMPKGISDRNADVWEPLIVIGDMAGGSWARRIREAAVDLTNARRDRDPSLGMQLLADCFTVFEARVPADRLRTGDLLAGFVALDERPWSNLRGEPLDARGLAYRLKRYDVKPDVHRFDTVTARGYLRADFEDAWSRYLPSLIPTNCVTRVTPETGAGSGYAVAPVTPRRRMREAQPELLAEGEASRD
jgi:hypothetical protein